VHAIDQEERTPFIGRKAELARLETLLVRVLSGRSELVLVAGDAGVGKTRLTEELRHRAERTGASTLVGGCLDLEDGRLPLGPFIEALRPGIAVLNQGARSDLGAHAEKELGRIFPELRSPAPASGAKSAVAQGQLFQLVLNLLRALAGEAPLVLVLEDLQWSDRSTRDLLAFVARHMRTERLLLVLTLRSDDVFRGHPLLPFLAELQRNRACTRIDLEPFTAGELSGLLAGVIGAVPPAALVQSVFDRSSGNAFYAEELARSWRNDRAVSQSLREIVLARLDRLTPATYELLRIVAVGGRAVSDELLAAICAVPEETRLTSLREAASHHFLVPETLRGYRFRHQLLREVVYDELLPGERSRLHAAYGLALSGDPGLAIDHETVTSDLARHWLAARDLPRALAAATQAGEAASRRAGFAEAQLHYESALEIWDQVPRADDWAGIENVELSRRAAEAANLAGEHRRAAALIKSAIGRVDRRSEPERAGVLWERLGRFLWASGDSQTALEAYEQAVALVPAHVPSAARARVLAARAQGLMLMGQYEHSRSVCQEAITMAREAAARPQEGHLLNTLGCDLAYLGQPDQAVRHLREALAIAAEVDDLDDLCRAYLNLSDILAGPLHRLEEALGVAIEGAELAQRMGMGADYGVSLQSNAATALIDLGRLDEAAALLTDVERRGPSEVAGIDFYRCSAKLHLFAGQLDAAGADVSAGRELMKKTVDPPYQSPMHAIEAEVALWQGRPDTARVAVATGLQQLSADDHWLAAPLLWLGLWAEADAALHAGGRRVTPERAIIEALGTALVVRGRRLLGRGPILAPMTQAYLRLSEAEGVRLFGHSATAAWEQAITTLEPLGHPYLEAYAHWRHGEALLADRRAREGTQALRRAHGTASGIGAQHLLNEVLLLASRARVELPTRAPSPCPRRAGKTRAVDTADTGLTARQMEVLRLVSAGMTNREIARALFISEKTAGAHVSSILAGLGVRSRVEAATAAHRLGLAWTPETEPAPS
jgi:DNA-binding CsgD family transcriptional regulator/tetratricopeptide (TPR) repeat protein